MANPPYQNPLSTLPEKPPQTEWGQKEAITWRWLLRAWQWMYKMMKPQVQMAAAFTPGDEFFYPLGTASGAFIVTLPLANSCMGKMYCFKKMNASVNTATITAGGTDTIDSVAPSIVLRARWDTVLLQSDGVSKWMVITGGNPLQQTRPYLDVEKPIVQPYVGGAFAQVTFTTTNFDTAGWWSSGSSNYTPLTKGDYSIQGAIVASSAVANDSFVVAIFKNGAQAGRAFFMTQVTANLPITIPFLGTLSLNGTTDVIDIRMFCANNSSIYGVAALLGNPVSYLNIKLLSQT